MQRWMRLSNIFLLTTLLAAGISCASAGGVASGVSGQVRLLTVTNQTGGTLKLLFISPSDSQYWGPDVLGATRTLAQGASAGFYLHYAAACGRFDIMGVHTDNSTFRIQGFEVCDDRQNQSVALQSSHSADPLGGMRLAKLRFRNIASQTMRLVFVSPHDSRSWGVDFLGQTTTLARGQTLELVIPTSQEAVRYNVMAAGEDDRQYTFNIDIDRSSETFTFPIEDSDLRQ
ncbi:MAG: hypothetical protein K1X75_09770 [Leptospirales bacterium]|nr:hypothetical protein [Leptospirales bacterium]